MSGGVSVRLDAGTRLRLASAQRLVLERGAVYLDSGPAPHEAAPLAVATPAGLFAEVGTQFEVRVADGDRPAAARLRVREGRVELRRDGAPVLAGAGEELVVRGDGGLVRRPVAVYGEEWDWVLAAAPRLEIEGLGARRFLEWIARESGRRLEFADARAAAIAEAAVLHGSIAHLDLEEAARVALASCGLGHRVADGALVVFVADDLRTPR
jgi:ferric-dicitrate binding protein FerR (iron transport regulator)